MEITKFANPLPNFALLVSVCILCGWIKRYNGSITVSRPPIAAVKLIMYFTGTREKVVIVLCHSAVPINITYVLVVQFDNIMTNRRTC